MPILKSIIQDSILQAKNYLDDHIFSFADALSLFLPFLMFFIGSYGVTWLGCELLIPVFAFVLIHLMRQYANKIGKGIAIPLPMERFTECQGDGEVNVQYARLQEMILYMADLEDWLKRNGFTENKQ